MRVTTRRGGGSCPEAAWPLPPSGGAVNVTASIAFPGATPEQFNNIGNGIGFLFALAVLVFTVVSVPMLLDRGGTLGTAIRTSLAACMLNPLPMACWGLIVAGLLLLGALPAFAGLAVAMPVLGHATWHLYRRLVE
jgi:uncharacterized membrane protein